MDIPAVVTLRRGLDINIGDAMQIVKMAHKVPAIHLGRMDSKEAIWLASELLRCGWSAYLGESTSLKVATGGTGYLPAGSISVWNVIKKAELQRQIDGHCLIPL